MKKHKGWGEMSGRAVIAKLRKRGWSMAEIAEEAGISLSFIEGVYAGLEKCDEGTKEELACLLFDTVPYAREEGGEHDI